MFNPPPNSYKNSGSFDDLLKRMTQRARQIKVDQQILELLQQVFERELEKENALLSRPERTRLFQQIAQTLLTDALEKLDGKNK
jgi:HD-GYP domain-containing protein (c-di-GMP phosphodiesterase class II)